MMAFSVETQNHISYNTVVYVLTEEWKIFLTHSYIMQLVQKKYRN